MLSSDHRKGFTLIELLVVIAIIGLLGAAVLVYLNGSRERSRNARRAADIRQIKTALDLYLDTCGSYPWLPPATTGIRLDSTKALYSGTAAGCGDQMGSGASGGIGGSPHTAGAGETVFVASFPSASLPADNASLPSGQRCTEPDNQLSNTVWNDYVYVSFQPSQYWVYFCVSRDTGGLQAGKNILTERGTFHYSGNQFP